MTVFCNVEDCRFIAGGICRKENISIDEYFECKDYESYLEDEEWKKPFWKRMKDDVNKRICRVKYYGKEIEVKGRKFFIESNASYATLTDAITGMSSGNRKITEERFEKIEELARRIEPPLEELPIATYNEHTRTFIYEEVVKGGVQG